MTTTKALWQKSVSKMKKLLPALPNSHGKRIKCLIGCGNEVSANVGICRDCRRKGRRRHAKADYQQRKQNNKQVTQ